MKGLLQIRILKESFGNTEKKCFWLELFVLSTRYFVVCLTSFVHHLSGTRLGQICPQKLLSTQTSVENITFSRPYVRLSGAGSNINGEARSFDWDVLLQVPPCLLSNKSLSCPFSLDLQSLSIKCPAPGRTEFRQRTAEKWVLNGFRCTSWVDWSCAAVESTWLFNDSPQLSSKTFSLSSNLRTSGKDAFNPWLLAARALRLLH
jgi:hypothetical protein